MRLVVVDDGGEVIVARVGQVLRGQDRLQNDADAEFFAFVAEAQSFLRVGKRLFGHGDLVSERPDAGVAGNDFVGNLIAHLIDHERDAAQARLPRVDISEIEIIDADMDVFPTGAALLIAPIMGDAVTGADDLAQLFDVEMEHFPRYWRLVTHDRRSWLQSTEFGETMAAQEPRDRGPGESAPLSDLKAREAQPAQSQDDSNLSGRRLTRTALRARGAILQTGHPFGPEAGQPFAHAALGEADLEGRRFDREFASEQSADHSFSTARRQSSMLMHVHVWVGLIGMDFFTPSTLPNPSPREQPIETSQLVHSGRRRPFVRGSLLPPKAFAVDMRPARQIAQETYRLNKTPFAMGELRTTLAQRENPAGVHVTTLTTSDRARERCNSTFAPPPPATCIPFWLRLSCLLQSLRVTSRVARAGGQGVRETSVDE